MKKREHKEINFHNKEFTDRTRDKISSYYSITRISTKFYIDYLEQICGNKNLLELGCGPGYRSFQLSGFGANVTSIDISDVAITQAKLIAEENNSKKNTFKVMDVEELNFKNGSFDIVCGISILHHLNLERVFVSIVKVLKTGGKAVFLEPFGHNPLINLYRKLTPKLRTEDEHPLHIKDIDIAKKYFSSVQLHYFHIFTFFAIPFRRFNIFDSLLKILYDFDTLLLKIFPFLKKYAWIGIIILSKSE